MTRATDAGRVAAWWGRWGRDLITFFAVALAAWSVWQNQVEGRARRDQSCTIFEKNQRDDVIALRGTYDYLAKLSPAELHDKRGINPAILRNLPNVEREALTDDAPPYCDEPGIGLEEPDDQVPDRPPNLPPRK